MNSPILTPICACLYAAVLLESEGEVQPSQPQISDYRTILPALSQTRYWPEHSKVWGGYKGLFDYVRYDKAKPGILARLGPFLDDALAGLIGGVSANMYTRAVSDQGNIN